MKLSILAAGLLAGFVSFSAAAADATPIPAPQGDTSMASQDAVNYCTQLYNQCYQSTGDSYGCQAQYQQCLDYYRNGSPYGADAKPPFEFKK